MNKLDLSLNERIDNKTSSDLSKYPSKELDNQLKEKIAKLENINRGEILLTNGAYHALEILERTISKDKKILIPSPTYPFFTKFKNEKLEITPLNKNLQVNIKELIGKIDSKIGGIYLVNPGNPSGQEIKQGDIKRILEKIKNTKTILIIDEAYFEFYGKSSKSLIKRYKNLVITRTFSKAYGLAGCKIGYIISNSKRIKELDKERGPVYCLNRIAIKQAIRKIQRKKSLKRYIQSLEKTKEKLKEVSKKSSLGIIETKTNFILIKTEDTNGFIDYLKNKKIKVKDLNNYPNDKNKVLEESIRITIGNKQKMKGLIRAIKRF